MSNIFDFATAKYTHLTLSAASEARIADAVEAAKPRDSLHLYGSFETANWYTGDRDLRTGEMRAHLSPFDKPNLDTKPAKIEPKMGKVYLVNCKTDNGTLNQRFTRWEGKWMFSSSHAKRALEARMESLNIWVGEPIREATPKELGIEVVPQ